MKHNHLRRDCRGLSLIELMVSITIGLVLMIAVMSTYLGSASAGKMAEAQGRMNEDGQAALTILSQQIRTAWDNPRQPLYDISTASKGRNPVFIDFGGTLNFGIRGCDGTFTNIAGAATIDDLNCAGGPSVDADSIAIVYEADPSNTVATAGGLATDCLGQSLPVTTAATPVKAWNGTASVATSVTFTVADNRFYVDRVNTVPSLYCLGNGNATPQPLVDNIEDLQLAWGLAAPATAKMTLAGYLDSADAVETNANLAALATSALRWKRVVAVRICVLVRSEEAVVSDRSSAQYVKCDGTTESSPPDLRLRRAYSAVVALRNRVEQDP